MFNMPFIKLSRGRMLNVNEVKSYKKSIREVPQERIEPGHGLDKVIRLPPKQETVLRLELNDKKTETLYGAEAEAAARILEGATS